MSLDYEKYNEAVQAWAVNETALLKSTGQGMGIKHVQRSPSKNESLKRIKERYGYDSSGVINRVTFGNINRSLMYTTYGAGKGMGGLKGSRWIDRYGVRNETASESMGKMGSGNRKAKPFIDQALDNHEGVEKLADIVAVHTADAIIDQIVK